MERVQRRPGWWEFAPHSLRSLSADVMAISGNITHRIRFLPRRPVRPLRPRGRRGRRAAVPSASRGDGASHLYRDVALVLFVGAVCGLHFGLTAGWQIAVESAQVVAGIVKYPADNPFYMYHVKSWTLLHQIPALLLACGVSEQIASMLISCTAAVLGQQALGLITYAFSRDRVVACSVPVLYLATNVCKENGFVYPIFLIPDTYWTTYGVTGTAIALFVWSLWGLGLRRSGALLCGLAPAIHPALGSWCVATTGAALLWTWRAERVRIAPILPWFTAGAFLTAVSFAAQQYIARGLPDVDPVQAKQILSAFVDGWDNHRVPVPLGHVSVHYGCMLLSLAAVVLAWFADKLPFSSRLLLRIFVISAFVSLVLCVVTHFSRWLPMAVVMAMPGRFINLANLAYPALLIGLLARWRRAWSVHGLLAGLALFCSLRTLTLSKHLVYVPVAQKIFVATGLILIYVLASRAREGNQRLQQFARLGALAGLIVGGLLWRSDLHLAILLWLTVPILWLLRKQLLRPLPPVLVSPPRFGTVACLWFAVFVKGGSALGLPCLLAASWPDMTARLAGRFRQVASLTAVAASIGLAVAALSPRLEAGWELLAEPGNDPVIAAARRESGMLLLVPRLGLAQLHTRRPVLMNGEAMNQLTYIPASGPGMNEIVKRIYGDDLLEPRPAGWQNWGGLMPHSGYELWQGRSTAEWQALAHEFGFTGILTGPEWDLALPMVAGNKTWRFYRIPEAAIKSGRAL